MIYFTSLDLSAVLIFIAYILLILLISIIQYFNNDRIILTYILYTKLSRRYIFKRCVLSFFYSYLLSSFLTFSIKNPLWNQNFEGYWRNDWIESKRDLCGKRCIVISKHHRRHFLRVIRTIITVWWTPAATVTSSSNSLSLPQMYQQNLVIDGFRFPVTSAVNRLTQPLSSVRAIVYFARVRSWSFLIESEDLYFYFKSLLIVKLCVLTTIWFIMQNNQRCKDCTFNHFRSNPNCPRCGRILGENDFTEVAVSDPDSKISNDPNKVFQSLLTKTPSNNVPNGMTSWNDVCAALLREHQVQERNTRFFVTVSVTVSILYF